MMVNFIIARENVTDYIKMLLKVLLLIIYLNDLKDLPNQQIKSALLANQIKSNHVKSQGVPNQIKSNHVKFLDLPNQIKSNRTKFPHVPNQIKSNQKFWGIAI